MKRTRRTIPLRRTLNLETLEDRRLLTGNVVATLTPATGTLLLTGDLGANAVQLIDATLPGSPNKTLRVQGVPGTFTSINGVQHIDFTLSTIQNITAAFGSSPTAAYKLQIIGTSSQDTTIPGTITVTANGDAGNTGSTQLFLSDINCNQVVVDAGGNEGNDIVNLTRVKAGQVQLTTGNGSDNIQFLSCNVGTLNVQTNNTPTNDQNNGDSVTISNAAGPASVIGDLSITAGVGSNSIAVTNTSSSKITVNNTGARNQPLPDSTGSQRNSSVINVSNNAVLTSITVTAGPLANSGAANATRQLVTVDNNTISFGVVNGNAIAVTVGTGENAQFFDANNNASATSDINTVSVSSNKLLNQGAIVVTAGDNLLQALVNGNQVAKANAAGIGLSLKVGDNSGFGQGGSAFAAGQVQLNNNAVPSGLLSVDVGTTNFATPQVAGTYTQNLNMSGDTSRFLSITVGSNNMSASTAGSTVAPQSVTLTALTVTGKFGDPTAPPEVAAGVPISIGAGGNAQNVTIDGLTAPAQHIVLQIGDCLEPTQSRSVTVFNVAADDFAGLTPAIPSTNFSSIGNGYSNIKFSNIFIHDSDSDFISNLALTIGTSSEAGTNITLTSITTDMDVRVHKIGNPTDTTNWAISKLTVGFDLFMNVGEGNQLLLLSNIAVTNALDIAAGAGINAISAHNVTALYGTIDAGSSGMNVFQDAGGNSGFATSGSSGSFVGADPMTLSAGDLSLSATTIKEGESVTLTGTFSHPNNIENHIVTIHWGDGSPDTVLQLEPSVFSFSATHTFLAQSTGPGAGKILVRIADSEANTVSAEVAILVQHVAPVIPPGGLSLSASTINEGTAVTLSGTFIDPGLLESHQVLINWGDGSTAATLNLGAGVLSFGTVSHTYQDNNPTGDPLDTYQILVTILDNLGASTSASLSLTVKNVAPRGINLGFDHASINEGDTVTLDGVFTDPGVLDGHTVVINWGDGSADTSLSLGPNSTKFSASHRYLDNLPGNAPYSVQVTITDKDNASASASALLTVMNIAPIADAGPDQLVEPGTPVTLTATYFDPGTGDGHTFLWTVASSNGQVLPSGSGPTFSFTPTEDGTYTVTLTVTDTDGAVSTTITTIDVAAGPVMNIGSLSGTLFVDANGNGLRDPGEAALPGSTAYVDLNGNGQLDPGEPTTITDVNGDYSFPGLAPGLYTVRLAPAANGTPPGSSDPVLTPGGSTGVLPNNVAFPVHHNTDLYGPRPNSDVNTAFVKGLYRSVLGRDGDADGITYWVEALSRGMSRQDVAWGFINSGEHRRQQLETYYQTFLGRSAYDHGSQYWLDLLQATGDEAAVITGILGSDEYRAKRASTPSFVSDLYFTLLGRAADADGAAYWENQLNGGMNGAAVVDGFLRSRELAGLTMQSYYGAFLHRAADPWQEAWIQELASGRLSFSQVAARFLASAEFFQSAGRNVP